MKQPLITRFLQVKDMRAFLKSVDIDFNLKVWFSVIRNSFLNENWSGLPDRVLGFKIQSEMDRPYQRSSRWRARFCFLSFPPSLHSTIKVLVLKAKKERDEAQKAVEEVFIKWTSEKSLCRLIPYWYEQAQSKAEEAKASAAKAREEETQVIWEKVSDQRKSSFCRPLRVQRWPRNASW